MMIAIGSDHGGYALKEAAKAYLAEKGLSFEDFGTLDGDRKSTRLNSSHEFVKGLLFCGTGVGMSIAANKVKGIRAACCSDSYSVRYTRLHNDANILCLGGRVVGPGLALELVELFLATPFEGGRHARRVGLISELENSNP
jgi:ribose 5-phosphate isomerase B